MSDEYELKLYGLGSAILTEMHGTIGCDPNCEKRYHSTFNGQLTIAEYSAIVGPSLTEDEWDAVIAGHWGDGLPHA